MTDLPQIADHQCQCATCQASRALRSLRALPTLTDDGRAALDTIEMGIDALFEDSFAGWDAMNDVAVAAGLEWDTATRQDIIDAIKQARARAAELEADNANWREALRMTNDALNTAHGDLMEMARRYDDESGRAIGEIEPLYTGRKTDTGEDIVGIPLSDWDAIARQIRRMNQEATTP